MLYPAVPSAAVPACFDWLAFVESLGDEELAAEIVALFIVEAPAMVTRRDAVRGDSIEEIRQAAHAFKGAVGNLARVRPMETSARLEAIARGRPRGTPRRSMTQLDQQVTGLLDELASSPPSKGTMRVLIRRHDRVMRHALGRKLSSWDFEPVPCSDGLEVRKVLEESPLPAIALIDWNMPGVDGLTLCRESATCRTAGTCI